MFFNWNSIEHQFFVLFFIFQCFAMLFFTWIQMQTRNFMNLLENLFRITFFNSNRHHFVKKNKNSDKKEIVCQCDDFHTISIFYIFCNFVKRHNTPIVRGSKRDRHAAPIDRFEYYLWEIVCNGKIVKKTSIISKKLVFF